MSTTANKDDAMTTRPDNGPMVKKAGSAPILTVLAAGALVAATSAALVGWTPLLDGDPGDKNVAERPTTSDRDVLQIQSTSDLETLYTLDSKDVETGLTAWMAVTTGKVHDDMAAITAADRTRLATAGTSSTAKMREIGIVKYMPNHKSAVVNAVIDVTVTGFGETTTSTSPVTATMALVGDRWLVAGWDGPLNTKPESSR